MFCFSVSFVILLSDISPASTFLAYYNVMVYLSKVHIPKDSSLFLADILFCAAVEVK